jgi:two-component system chemotaxis response regulator CheY
MSLPHNGKSRVLIVDDDADALDALSDVLEAEGFETICAEDGQKAWELIHQTPKPSLVVLDLLMPKMDGWTFRMHQRRDPRLADIPVVVVSSQKVVDDGLEAVFTKPLDLPNFLKTVKRVAEAKGAPTPVLSN